MWWNFTANALQLLGAVALLTEWVWAYRSPPFLFTQLAVYSAPDDPPDTENEKATRGWNRMRAGRGLLAGAGYAFLGAGLFMACWQSWGT